MKEQFWNENDKTNIKAERLYANNNKVLDNLLLKTNIINRKEDNLWIDRELKDLIKEKDYLYK